jgi:zinc protease
MVQDKRLALGLVLALVSGCATARTSNGGAGGDAGLRAAGGSPGFGGLGVHLPLEQHTLSNGLHVVMIEDHTVPVISYQTWIRSGSVDETPGHTGIAHLFEHLMFKGTPRYGAKQFFEQLEAKGAEVNAFTTRDYTVYHEDFTPSLLAKVVDMESDRLSNLKLDQEVLDTERQVVLEERRMRTDNSPGGRIQEALWGLAFRRHPYNWPVIGYPQDLMGMKVDRLLEFYRANYQPANATLVVVGDIDPKALLDRIRKAYEPIPARPRPVRDIDPEPEQREERRITLYDRVASQRFSQAYHVTSAADDDSYALDVLANILFEGTSSRAYRSMVDEKDIVAGIGGSAYTPTFPGLFIVTATMKGKLETGQAEAELERLIGEVQEKGVTQDEIKRAVKQLTVQLVDSVRTPHGMAQLVGTVATVLGDPEKYSNDLEKYLKVSASDVQRVARKYLTPNNRSVVVMVPGSGKSTGDLE